MDYGSPRIQSSNRRTADAPMPFSPNHKILIFLYFKKKPKIVEGLAPFSDDEVLAAIREVKGGKAEEKPVKQVELEALLAAPEGFGDDVPIDPNFHARRLPDRA
jgi:hypothetical protein